MKVLSRKWPMLLLFIAFMILLAGGAGKNSVGKNDRGDSCRQAAAVLVRGTVSSSPAEWSKAARNNPLWLIEISVN